VTGGTRDDDTAQPAAERPPERPAGPSAEPGDGADAAVPRLPRSRGLRLSGPQMFRIAGLLIVLVFLLIAQRPCANAVSTFVTGFGSQGSAAATMPKPGTVDVPAAAPAPAATGSGSAGGAADPTERYERLRPGMTEDEVKAVIERARAKAATGSGGTGSAAR